MDHSSHHGHHMSSPPATSTEPSLVMGSEPSHALHGAGSSVEPHGMMMYFHFGFGDRVLFYDWVLSNVSMTVLTCCIFFVLAFLYEGLKCYREFLIKKRILLQRSFPIAVVGAGSDHRVINEGDDVMTGDGADSALRSVTRRTGRSKIFNIPHVFQSLLHVFQVAMSYTLMLGFMTFNAWICISILLGVGMGYFTFCWRKLSVVDVTEHCH